MSKLVLIDSSVWMEAGRITGNVGSRDKVTALLESGCAAMTAPVWMEIYRGVKGRREEELTNGWKLLCHWLPFDSLCWETAARTARVCQRSGVNVPFGDILVYACAKRHKVELFECDKHFAMIEAASGKRA